MRYSLLFALIILFYQDSFAQSKKYEANYYYRGTSKSLVEWENLDPVDFIDYDIWLRDTKLKDKWTDWEKNVREKNLDEKIGKVLHCVGTCRFYRGVGHYKGQFRSTILEGDEVLTGDNSYSWLFLFDGTMVRLSPNSSITFKEFNIGQNRNFLHARVNSGNILWLSRLRSKYIETNERETDALFLPMPYYDALPETKSNQYAEDNLLGLLEESQSTLKQYQRLNTLIAENNEHFPDRKTFSFLVTPTGSISGESLNVEFISLIGNESYLKRRTHRQLGLEGEGSDVGASFYYRGLDNKKVEEIEEDTWYRIGRKGREIETFPTTRLFHMGELITRRIPTILVARELLMKEYSDFLTKTESERVLAKEYGYRKWGSYDDPKSDFKLRFEYLKEFTRRMETTNLLASQRLREKLKTYGEESKDMTYSSMFFNRALVEYHRNKTSITDNDIRKESLNSTKNKFWKMINEIK